MKADNDNGLGVPPGIYSVEEACNWLKISRFSLTNLIIEHPHYAKNGNRKLFSQAHINKLWEAMQCQNSSSPSVLEATTGTSAVPTAQVDRYSDLLKPKTRRLQRHSSSSIRRAT